MSNSVPYLTEAEISRVLNYPQLVPLMAQTLIEFSTGQTIQPVRQMLEVEKQQRYLGVMPAVLPTAMGAKLVCFYPKNSGTKHHTHLASIALFDPETGQPLAFLDGRLITEMRTAATSAAVTRIAANPESRSIALLGSGVQAKAHLTVLRSMYDIDDVRVWSRTASHAKSFASAHTADNCPMKAMAAEPAVRGADIIVCATNALTPILQGKWLKPGAHVNSVGSPRPDWRELDNDVMSNLLIVDSREAVLKESGDVRLSGADIYAEAGEVLSGRAAVDISSNTVFKSVGIAVEDMAAARLVYDLVVAGSD